MAREIPQELRQLLTDQYGEGRIDDILEGFTCRRCVTLRVNTIKTNTEAVKAQLREAGIAFSTVEWSAQAIIIDQARESALKRLPIYNDGEIYLQSLSSMLPPLLLSPKAGECILDMAAAPGGKTTQLAALSGNKALITACEKNKIRAQRLEYNIQKQGASRVTVMVTDSRRLNDFFQFDQILLDAPCSGSGTITPTDTGFSGEFSIELLNRCVKTQEEMLKKALRLLKPGHEMVYSTCSILSKENEEVLKRAIHREKAEIVPIDEERFTSIPRLPTRLPGTLLVCPTKLYEGFFAAKIRRKK